MSGVKQKRLLDHPNRHTCFYKISHIYSKRVSCHPLISIFSGTHLNYLTYLSKTFRLNPTAENLLPRFETRLSKILTESQQIITEISIVKILAFRFPRLISEFKCVNIDFSTKLRIVTEQKRYVGRCNCAYIEIVRS